MKNKLHVPLVRLFGFIALVAVIGFSFAACGDDGGDDGGGTFTTISAFEKYLTKQPANTPDTPYSVKLNLSNLGGSLGIGSSVDAGSLGNVLLSNETKYVSLDLSGSTITTIPWAAFSSCSSLTGIVIPNSVTSIEEGAFTSCKNLTSVTIPNSVTSIGMSAFSYCDNLTEINVDADNNAFTSEEGVLYNKNKTTLIQYPGGKTGAFTIPDSVTSLRTDRGKDGAFTGCKNLTSVTIPSSVTSIGYILFQHCSNLTKVEIKGNSLTSIGDHAFDNCTSLTSVTILDSVTSIGDYAFFKCINLESAPLGSGVTSIGQMAFDLCTDRLASVTIPNKVTSIGWHAFSSCNKLNTVTFQSANVSFDNGTFPGTDLRTKYTAGSIGTYTRPNGGSTWTKQ
jgi:hypothetical protein